MSRSGPSTYPCSRRPLTNASAVVERITDADAAPARYPTRGRLACARAARGHAAAPPRSVMKPRLFIRSPRRAIRRTGRYGISSRYPWSVDFGAGELDHLGPLLCICGDECAEVGGRACKHGVAEVGDPRLHAGISEARVDLPVELVDDRRRCIPGRADPLPASSLVARDEVAYGRDVWQHLRARRRSHR